MNLSYKEKRRDIRYTIKAPALLSLEDAAPVSCLLFLHDISSGGALVSSTIALPQNAKVAIRIKLPFRQKWFGRNEVEVICHGEVIREIKDKKQVAIQFSDDYRIRTELPD